MTHRGAEVVGLDVYKLRKFPMNPNPAQATAVAVHRHYYILLGLGCGQDQCFVRLECMALYQGASKQSTVYGAFRHVVDDETSAYEAAFVRKYLEGQALVRRATWFQHLLTLGGHAPDKASEWIFLDFTSHTTILKYKSTEATTVESPGLEIDESDVE